LRKGDVVGRQTEDLFDARLKRLKTGEPRRVSHLGARDYPQTRQNSVLLPYVAMGCLILGGAAFAFMLAMPDPSGTSIATNLSMELLRP
jgi:hypothetical protein